MIAVIRNAKAVLLLALLLVLAPTAYAGGAEPKPHVKTVAFGLFGDQDVFESEAKGAAEIAARRFGGGPAIVRFNSKTRADATAETLAAALQSAAKGMSAERDILLVILTSHGSPGGVAVKTPGRAALLTPLDLFTMLDATHVRHRIVIVSACFSGVFIPPLADPDTLVITAADAQHPSFGCRNGATWTYFGDAFFNMALRQTANLRDAFALASVAVRKRETQEHYEPSNPQMAGGENVERMLSGAPVSNVAPTPDARYAPAFAGRGEAYGERRDFDHAVAAYNEAIRLDPKYAPAYAGRGLTYHVKGDLDHAIADYSAALQLEPRLYFAYYQRGVAYVAESDNNRAIADFTQAIKLNPRFPDAFAKRALAYRANGDEAHAEADLKEAVRLKSGSARP